MASAKTTYRTIHPSTGEEVTFTKGGRPIRWITWGDFGKGEGFVHFGYSSQEPYAKAVRAPRSTNPYAERYEATPATVVEDKPAGPTLAEQFPINATAVYAPKDGARDVVMVKSAPDADGKADAISGRLNGEMIRVALADLHPIPAPLSEPQGEMTQVWSVLDRDGREVARVQGGETRTEAMKVVEADPVAGPVSRREGGVGLRRLRSSELTTPVGELRGLPRKAPAPRVVSSTTSNGRTVTVTAGVTRKSIPTRLRESGAPGGMAFSKTAGALRWVLPGGEELTPGEAAKRYLGD
ncbi:hypothetical protein SEA_GILGAMESH_120 [Streptomyces phage Gilgamesh]|uniref:Uncharacterized protein n=1 Tax=Streptomyces phage Gilgamesh TaxID=2599890 RepID=A0A5J6TXV6_9CAUD|nr:hypothetical protein QEH35_gp120 [Streptomyces phage Gilgamesh]QFG13312.1 hypothetical protein SEA_GILGAMESH_120 [Streptomyces phage Gilgamesh]